MTPSVAVRRLGPRLKIVHLKDVEAARAEHNVLLGTGIANIPGVMQELRKMRFPRLVAIEFEKKAMTIRTCARNLPTHEN